MRKQGEEKYRTDEQSTVTARKSSELYDFALAMNCVAEQTAQVMQHNVL